MFDYGTTRRWRKGEGVQKTLYNFYTVFNQAGEPTCDYDTLVQARRAIKEATND